MLEHGEQLVQPYLEVALGDLAVTVWVYGCDHILLDLFPVDVDVTLGRRDLHGE
jgi:hypothetical protein